MCLGIVFGLKRPSFGCIFSSKSMYMTSKMRDETCHNTLYSFLPIVTLSFGVPRMPYHKKNPKDFDCDGGRAAGRTNGFAFLKM